MEGKGKTALGIGLAITALCVAIVAMKRLRACGEATSQEPDMNDPVDLYIEESFPASDPPSYSPILSTGGKT